MSSLQLYLRSTIGRKQVVGVTGLGLALFVFTHALGNMLIFVGPEAYNMYSHKLISNPLIYVAEAGLLALFIGHVTLATVLTVINRQAKEKYAVSASGEKRTSATTKTMWHQGMIILIFVVLHLITFKFGPYYETTYDGEPVRDLFQLLIEVFQSPVYVVGYIFALLVLGFHLSHGVSSAIRTLGFNHPQYDKKVRCFGLLFALLVTAMFVSQPIYVMFYY